MLFGADDGLSGWAALAGSVANVGFAAIVGWYLLTKALPKMQQDFREELRQQHHDFGQSEKERRIENKEALQLVIAHCEREAVRRDTSMHSEIVEVTQAITDNREVLEEVRDVMRDVRTCLADQKKPC